MEATALITTLNHFIDYMDAINVEQNQTNKIWKSDRKYKNHYTRFGFLKTGLRFLNLNTETQRN